ncbi:hypothetical protein [Terrisporobacter hibernicus]|nr:hypothetical protein [Terrisporobacter hibernicus]
MNSIVRVTSGLFGGLGGRGCIYGTLCVANISTGLLFDRSEGNY